MYATFVVGKSKCLILKLSLKEYQNVEIGKFINVGIRPEITVSYRVNTALELWERSTSDIYREVFLVSFV